MLKKENIWLWCHPAGSFEHWGKTLEGSTITPGEAMRALGIDNAVMVRSAGKPEAAGFPAALADLSKSKRLKWSIVGDSGSATTPFTDLDTVLRMRNNFPNLDGVMLDDFFPPANDPIVTKPRMTPAEMEDMREILDRHRMTAWVVLYEHQLQTVDRAYFRYVDAVNFWTWYGDNLDAMPANVEQVRKTSGKPVVLGIYLWDFGHKIPLTEQQMELQLANAAKLHDDGLITDVIFLASCLADRELDALRVLRRYTAQLH